MNKEQLVKEILELKKEKNALILAHYYQNDEIQAISDYVGDSYQLSKIAKDTDADILVFCGVTFMAETAKILSPNKKVLLPRMDAGCFMADTITPILLKKHLEENPNTKVICYVNTSAAVKALCDVCVTSSNAEKVIDNFISENGKDVNYLYVPDKNLAKYLNKTKNLNINCWNGYCDIHDELTKEMVIEAKEKYPNATLVVHPEAPLDVVELADFAGSTLGIINYCLKSDAKEFIVGTEKGILYKLNEMMPNKKFYILSENLVCKTMKYTTLEDLYRCLKEENNEILLEDEIILKAKKSLDKMFELSK